MIYVCLKHTDVIHVFACLGTCARLSDVDQALDANIISYCMSAKLKKQSIIMHSKRTILQREAKICTVKPCSVFALWDIVSYSVQCIVSSE